MFNSFFNTIQRKGKHTRYFCTVLFLCAFISVSYVFPIAAYASPVEADTLITLTNQARQDAGFARLEAHYQLTQAARRKALDIIKEGYFSHTTPSGKPFYQWIEEEDYAYLYAGENLAIDFVSSEGAVDAWLASPLHRKNILNKEYTHIGIATARGIWRDHETTVVVQLFGSELRDSDSVLGQSYSLLPHTPTSFMQTQGTALADSMLALPSIAGIAYFDIFLSPTYTTSVSVTRPYAADVAATPTTEIVQGDSYQTLAKTEQLAGMREPVFSLTERTKTETRTTPRSFPPLSLFIKKITAPQYQAIGSTNNTLIFAGTCILLLAAHYEEIRKALLRRSSLS